MFSLALTARTHARKSRDLKFLLRFSALWFFEPPFNANAFPINLLGDTCVKQLVVLDRQTRQVRTELPTEFSSSNSFRFFTFFFTRVDGSNTNGLLGMLSRPLWIWASDLVAFGTTELLCSYYPLGFSEFLFYSKSTKRQAIPAFLVPLLLWGGNGLSDQISSCGSPILKSVWM